MTAPHVAALNQEWSSEEVPSEGLLFRSFRWAGLPLLLLVVAGVGAIPMDWKQQIAFGAFMVLAAIVVNRSQKTRAGTLILVMFSMSATARYGIWRVGALHRYFTSPWQTVDPWNAVFMLMLIGAELYSFLILYLGYMQTIAPLRRPPFPLPASSDEWPTVDLMIPTYNEPMDVVRYTVLAAKQLDWPADKLKIYLLDDGNRANFRAFAAEAGVEYIARPEHTHAKAGNINYALDRTSAQLVAIFDCDHVPTRSFLQMTAGWFLRDPRLAMLQTPHHFYSADPFERNLGHFRSVPNEGELFYGIIQDTNDLWNATFFCGSCALIRRTALQEVHGIAHETVTEDAHTSLRMQKLGWNTAYVNLRQSGGLATEKLADHVKQRVRWARGMCQIMRIDNPLLATGMALPQRLCYLNAMLHFMYALPRLIFLSAPVIYLVFGKLNMPGYWVTILVFAIPHLILSTMTNSRIQGMKRYSFWNEIYETVLSPYILLPTLLALVSPKLGKFDVTAKGQSQEEDYFDSKLARPFLWLLGLNMLGLVMAIPRYLYWDQGHPGTVIMNCVWTLFNMVILGVTLSICWESRQRRGSVRVATRIPVSLEARGAMNTGLLEDLSVGGASAIIGGQWDPEDFVRISFPTEDPGTVFTARVVGVGNGRVRLSFDIDSMEHQEAITRVLYLRADRWLDWTDGRQRDNILGSLLDVFGASAKGFGQSLRLFKRKPAPAKPNKVPVAAPVSTKVLPLLLLVALPFLAPHPVAAETPTHPVQKPAPKPAQDPAAVHVELPLGDLGARTGVLLDRANPDQGLSISLPDDVLLNRGVLHLKYTLPESKEAASTLEILLNDTMLAAITPSAADQAAGRGEATIPLPAELMVRQNQLTLRLADTGAGGCSVVQATASPSSPILINPDSSFSFEEERLLLASDLSLLPEPFVQRVATKSAKLPIVFAHLPTARTLEAAGVLVSWLGSETHEGQTHYPVSLGSLPRGNAVVILLAGESLAGLEGRDSSGASITTVANPEDPYGKLLVLSAPDPDTLLALTQALALGQIQLSGDTAALGTLKLPALRSPDDAPRWIHTRRVSLQSLNSGNPLATTNASPLNLYLRFSPDYNFGPDRDMYLHLDYGNDAQALDPHSNLVVRLNGFPARSVPLHAHKASQQANLALGTLPTSIFANTLQAQFYFVPPAAQRCVPMHYGGTIGPGSYIDLGNANHLAKLPELRLFSNAGFPFTRLADLAETAVLLPDRPTPAELALYLDLLSYFGSQTGYPALHVEVGRSADAASYGSKDLLVLGTFGDLPTMPALAAALPLQLRDESWQLTLRARVMEKYHGWEELLQTFGRHQNPPLDLSAPGGVIEGAQSPYSGNRSLVMILGSDDASLQSMTTGLLAELPHDGIAGSVSLWQDGSFVSRFYSTSRYYLGDVNPLTRMEIILPQHPLALLLGVLAAFILFAVWLNAWVENRIRLRLMGVPFDLDGKANAPAL